MGCYTDDIILFLINTDSIPVLKTLLGKAFPRPFLVGWVWGPDYIMTCMDP